MSLEDRIRRLIGTAGPLPVSDYMAMCLFDPADGYYKPDVYLYYALTFLMPPASALIRGALGKGQKV